MSAEERRPKHRTYICVYLRSSAVPFLFLAACLASVAPAREKGARERTFVHALEVFDEAKTPQEYGQAAALWESLLADGYQNGAVYYNIGNAYMKAGEYGRAIAAYRKGRYYRPRDPYLEANLNQALALAPGRLPETPAPWWQHVLFWSGWLSYPEKFLAVVAVFGAACAVAAAGLLLRKRRAYWGCGALATVALFLSADAALAYLDVAESRKAVIVTETVARKGMGEKYEPAFDKPLKDGAEFTIIGRSGQWVLGHFEGIGDGWLRQETLVE
ncbi:MAG: tetratricopeptide repeat protein [Planctomycetota bacterium]